MKALSVRQPHAGAILTLGKAVENRAQAWQYRGTLLIHSSQRIGDGDAFHEVARISGRPVPVLGHPHAGVGWEVGSIIGAVNLVGAHQSSACEGPEGMCSPWAHRNSVHLELTNPRVLAFPVPCNGALGLWTPDDFSLRKAQEGMPRAA